MDDIRLPRRVVRTAAAPLPRRSYAGEQTRAVMQSASESSRTPTPTRLASLRKSWHYVQAAVELQTSKLLAMRQRTRLIAAALLIASAEIITIVQPYFATHSYALGAAGGLLAPVNQSMASMVKYDAKQQGFVFSSTLSSGTGTVRQDNVPAKIFAAVDPSKGITATDNTHQISFTMKPQFSLQPGQQQGNRIVYPFTDNSGWAVYSLHSVGPKEDVLLTRSPGDTLQLDYTLGLGNDLAARLESNGDIGIYGNTLLSGSVATGSDQDAALLQKGRANAAKDTLLFRLPAPTVTDKHDSEHYDLHGTTLSVRVSGLNHAHYPLSIDPSIYVTTAQNFMRGNNETNIDFDVTNALIQKGKTTGARFNSWTSTLALPTATWNNATAVAGGFIYSVGGITSGGTVATLSWAQLDTASSAIIAPNPGGGACSSWCTSSAYNLPAVRAGASLIAYNGFLFVLGGVNGSNVLQNTVYIAKLGANGEPQLWHPTSTDKTTWTYWYASTNTLPDNIAYSAAVAYNNRLYILGGKSTTNPNGDAIVRVTNLNPTGDIGAWSSTGMTQLSSGATARFGHSAQVYNDRMYILGGNNAGTLKNDVYYIKLNTDGTMASSSWTATTSFSTARMTWGGSFSTVWGAYIYLSGGCSAVNGSGYCTTIAGDTQIASINADGSLDIWNTNASVTDARIGYGLVAWRSVIYEVGGCTAQNTSTGACTTISANASYGTINQDGDASTVAQSVTNGTSPCSGGSPSNCDLPGTTYIGNMLAGVAITGGYLYVISGCTADVCATLSPNVAYVAISSTGTMTKPASCPSGGYQGGIWCVDTVNTITGGLAASSPVVFNGRIYLVGGLVSAGNTNTIYYTATNTDGSIGTWTSQSMTGVGAVSVAYDFAYARANPASAGTNPGNLYIFGGCTSTTQIGCSGYTQNVYKCNIQTSGAIAGCSTANQLLIGIVPGDTVAGLGLMSGTVYANYIYLIGGVSPNQTDLKTVRYAKFNNSNNVVTVSSGWVEASNQTAIGRRRGSAFGYNGYIYVVGGYDGTGGNGVLADIEFAKVNVSDGSIGVFTVSAVTINQRWGLTVPVSNSYAYVIGGCNNGASPSGCTSRTDTIQTFQIYNNDSGAPAGYTNAANTYATDPNRMGIGSAILNGYIYAAGGCTSTTDCITAVNTVSYAPIDANGAIGSWSTTTAALPAVRTWGKLEAAGGSLYYIGGQDSAATNEQSTVYYATPSSGNISTWGTASNGLPGARTKFGAAVWNNRIYVVGGLDGSAAVTATVYVSPQLNSGGNIGTAWSTGTALGIARYGAIVAAYANNLYTFGGNDGTNYLTDSQYSQLSTSTGLDGAWTYTTSLPTPLAFGDSFAVNGYMYILGGQSTTASCRSITLASPISANTTIASGNNPTGVGEWFETNQRFTASRYGSSAVYNDGKAYILGGACPSTTSPTVTSVTSTPTSNTGFSTATTSTTHNVQMPATVASGDLLLVFLSTDNNFAVTTAGGWTQLATTASGANGVTGSVYAKVAAGTEGGTQVNFATGAGNNSDAAAQTYRILAANWYGTIATGVATSTAVSATTANPNPGTVAQTWYGENSLWIAYAAGSVYQSVTSYPTNYASGTHNNSGTTTTDASVSTATRSRNTVSEDPGTFTMNASQASVSYTVAVRPALGSLTYAAGAEVQQTPLLTQPQIAKYSIMMDTDSDVYPNIWLLNGVDNSIGASWQLRYRSMTNPGAAVNCASSVMSTWGTDTTFGNVTLGLPGVYTPRDGSNANTNCARYFYFFVSVDSSQAYGYPDDVTRGPTIADLTLGYTSDPSKRLMHGRTFVGGLQQPDDTPCHQSAYAACPLP